MFRQENRITLIAREATKPDVDWNYARCRGENVAFLDSIGALKFALLSAQRDGLDVERMIVDRAGSADDPHFANQAEVECARILDFYGLEWKYEPRSFVLRRMTKAA